MQKKGKSLEEVTAKTVQKSGIFNKAPFVSVATSVIVRYRISKEIKQRFLNIDDKNYSDRYFNIYST